MGSFFTRLAENEVTMWLPVAGTLLLAWLALWNKLRGDWSANDQYEYGWFVPPLALALFVLRWADRPAPLPDRRTTGTILAWFCLGAMLLLWPTRLVEEPNPDWRLLFWVHASLLVCLTLGCCRWMGGQPWLRHFAFPVGFLLLAVPWPSGPEQAIVQSLMRKVAEVASEGMNVLGIPAVARGNLVHIRDQTVGVSEACSGIRSLQTTLMASFLLGELSRLPWLRRLALVGGGLTVAMAANVFRSSLLVWIAARHGAAALAKVHDLAGFSVLLIVFGGLLLLDRSLAKAGSRASVPAAGHRSVHPATHAFQRIPKWFLLAAASWVVIAEAGTLAWYGLYAPPPDLVPRWTVSAPSGAPGFQKLGIDENTRQLLRYDHGSSARWSHPGRSPLECTMFFFRWEPGHASTTQGEMHQPHLCMTANGLTQLSDSGVEPLLVPAGITLPVRRYEFTLHGRSVFVYFVAWQDRVGAQSLGAGDGSRWDRLRAVREHRANLGRQTLELVATGATDARQANAWLEQELGAIVRPAPGEGRAASP